MSSTFILTEKQEKDNRIAHRILELVEFIDANWRKIEERVEAIVNNLQCKQEKGN